MSDLVQLLGSIGAWFGLSLIFATCLWWVCIAIDKLKRILEEVRRNTDDNGQV